MGWRLPARGPAPAARPPGCTPPNHGPPQVQNGRSGSSNGGRAVVRPCQAARRWFRLAFSRWLPIRRAGSGSASSVGRFSSSCSSCAVWCHRLGPRAALAPAGGDQAGWEQGNGRVTVGAFSFTVDGHVYMGQDELTPKARRGSRTWSRDELPGMQVCFDPARPGEEFALAPARYRCGNPEILTSDGGW